MNLDRSSNDYLGSNPFCGLYGEPPPERGVFDSSYFFLLRIRSAHLEILGFPMGGAY